MSNRSSPAAARRIISPNRSTGSLPPSTPPRNPNSGEPSNGEGMVVVMQQVLDQMERCFQTDHSARRDRILQLELRQKDLETMYTAAEKEQHAQYAAGSTRSPSGRRSNSSSGGAARLVESEVSKFSAKCDESVAHLLEECRLQQEEKARFQKMNEGLEQELRRLRELEHNSKTKIEQLARNVVKALKERAVMADELESTKAQVETTNRSLHEMNEAANQRDDALTTLAELRAELDSQTKMTQLGDLEVRRLGTLLDRHLQEDDRHRKETAASSERLIGQVTQQLAEVNTEKELVSSSFSETQLSNQRLSEELRQMIASRKDRDERLAAAERELVHERTRRLGLEREITLLQKGGGGAGGRRSTSAFDDGMASVGTPTTIGAPPGATIGDGYEVHKEVVRLQALLDRVQLEHAETLRHTEQRVLHANSLYEQANERCRGYEHALLELRQQAAHAGRERTKAQLTVQALRQKLVGVQAEGATSSAAITTTKADVEEAMANANSDLELRFAQQIHKDFASIAYFFSQLRNLDTEAVIRLAGHSTGAAAVSSPNGLNSGLPAAPESGLGVPPHQLSTLGSKQQQGYPLGDPLGTALQHDAQMLPPLPMQQWATSSSYVPLASTRNSNSGPRRSPSLSELTPLSAPPGSRGGRPSAGSLVSPSALEG